MPPYVAEMPLAGFKTAELFLLTTLRLWLAAQRRARVPDWRRGLAAAGLAEDGAPDLDMALRILIAGARTLDSRETAHPRLSADEARLLRLFGALQHGDTGEAVAILQAWLPSKPLRWLMRYARSFCRRYGFSKVNFAGPDGRYSTAFCVTRQRQCVPGSRLHLVALRLNFDSHRVRPVRISCSMLGKFLQ